MKWVFYFVLWTVTECAFRVTYAWNDAPAIDFVRAVDRAVNIMTSYINTTNTIYIELGWKDCGSDTIIANTHEGRIVPHPEHEQLFIPIALYAQLADDAPHAEPHVYINFNVRGPYPFYFGVDGRPPAGYMDFVTILLHEMMHGLGFSTQFGNAQYYNLISAVHIYDYYIFRAAGIFPCTTHYPLHGTTLLNDGAPLFFNGVDGVFQVYTPSPFSIGSSIGHTADASSLMYYRPAVGVAIHYLTQDCVTFLKTVGYPVRATAPRPPCVSSASILISPLW